jgi:hypothetical protein
MEKEFVWVGAKTQRKLNTLFDSDDGLCSWGPCESNEGLNGSLDDMGLSRSGKALQTKPKVEWDQSIENVTESFSQSGSGSDAASSASLQYDPLQPGENLAFEFDRSSDGAMTVENLEEKAKGTVKGSPKTSPPAGGRVKFCVTVYMTVRKK